MPHLACEKPNGGNASCAVHSCYPTNFSTSRSPQSCDLVLPRVSFTAVEAATEKDPYLPFGPTDKPAASLEYLSSGDDSTKHTGLLRAFGHVSGEETDVLAFTIKGRPFQGVWLREYVIGNLVVMLCGVAIAVMIHYLWLLMAAITGNWPEMVGDVTTAEDWLLLTASPAAGLRDGDSKDCVIFLVDSD